MNIEQTDDLQTCLDLRHEVFVREQGVPAEIENDETDPVATHFLAWVDGRPVGTARTYVVDGVGRIGRVCVTKPHRGTGLGVALIDAGIRHLADAGLSEVQLGAQVVALGFYEQLGFVAFGPGFDSAGIPHQMMRRVL